MPLARYALISCLLLYEVSVAQSSFSYDRCDMRDGPFGSSSWGAHCQTAKQQSGTPIDLCGAVPFPAPPRLQTTGYQRVLSGTTDVAVLNNGHTVQINIKNNVPTMSAGTLPNLVGRAPRGSNPKWSLAHIHLHWGRARHYGEGSEHYKQGVQYAGEAHLVHFNPAAGSSLAAAIQSGRSDSLLVVGVLLKAGDRDESATIAAMADAVAFAKTKAAPLGKNVMLHDLWDPTGDWYAYGGSLTTPACNEDVTWIVMGTPVHVAKATFAKLYAASTDPDHSGAKLISAYGNFRPLTPTRNRTVYHSAGATAPCVRELESPFLCESIPGSAATAAFAWALRPAVYTPAFLCVALALAANHLRTREDVSNYRISLYSV